MRFHVDSLVFMRFVSSAARVLHLDAITVLAIKGFPVRQAAGILKQMGDVSNFTAYHEQKCWEVYDFFLQHCDAYNQLNPSRVNSWDRVPVTHRRILNGIPDRWFPDVLNHRNLYRSNTSGSSGTPFFFARDALSHALVWKSVERFYRSAGVNLYDLQARFFGISRHKEDVRKARIKDALACRYRFDVYDVSAPAIQKWLKDFGKHPYRYIYGYSNTLIAFASYLVQSDLVLVDLCPSLICCIVTSEVCSDQDANLISKAFGVPVYNEYGSSELGIIGFKQDGHWIGNDALLYLEVLDEAGKVLPDGEVGLLTVTHLYNRATPFIRYQTGDLASIQRLPDGRTVITSLQGSVNDMAITSSGKKIPGISFYFVAQKLLDARVDIHEFVVVQKSISSFVFKYVAESPLGDDEVRLLLRGFADYVDAEVDLAIERLPVIPRGANGKFKHFISDL